MRLFHATVSGKKNHSLLHRCATVSNFYLFRMGPNTVESKLSIYLLKEDEVSDSDHKIEPK